MTNPFDFTDFGAPSVPAGSAAPAPGAPLAPGPSQGGSGAFDPWAGQPAGTAPHPPQPREIGTTEPVAVFSDAAAPAFDPTGGLDAFGQFAGNPALGALTTAGPPLIWFGAAGGLALVGALIAGLGALAGGTIFTAVVGWLLAGPLAIGAVAMFNRVDTRRRTEAIYSAPGWTSNLYWIVLAVCLVGIAIGAWQIALWAGTR